MSPAAFFLEHAMIFDCPNCGEEMEVSDKKAGSFVNCVTCGELVEVRERHPSGKKRKRKPKQGRIVDKLSGTEYMIFGVLFALFPCANVMATGVLYIFWNETHPNKAYQLNQLCWIIFASQIFLTACLGSILCIGKANM